MMKKITLGAWLQTYEQIVLRRAESGQIKQKTLSDYRRVMRFSSENWSSYPLDEISVADITEVIHKKALSAPFAARRLRINLSSVFVEAQRAGVLPLGHNPALVSVHPIATVETERLLLSEWLRVFRVAKYAAPDYFEIAMLLALVTAQRPSDLVRMHSDHIYDGLLHVVQFKTGERIALPTALRLDETGTSIQDVIDICPPGFLLQNSRGQPVNTWSLSRWFRICREQAGITSMAGKPPPFKEQRSLWGPLGKRKISYAKPVFCTDCCLLSVTNGISPVPA